MTENVTILQPENVDITLLKTDGQNPNRMTKEQHERLATSIKKYGFIVPIITNRDLLIADGEQRFEVAKSLGMPQVPVIRLDVQDVDRRLLRQVLNKLRGEHELVADALEFEKIIQAGHEDDLKHLLDLNDSQLERYLSEIREPKPEDYEIPEIEKIQTDIKRGDIYQLGKHRLMCGDATIEADYDQLFQNASPRMIFADPPYGVAFDKHRFHDEGWVDSGFKNWGEIEGDKTIAMIKAMPKTSDYVFIPDPRKLEGRSRTMQVAFDRQRNRLAVKLQNPRLRQIHFHTFRHWKATMLYHKTRDILLVKYTLGHRRLENTEVYTHLVGFQSNEHDSATAKTVEEAKLLVEAGFEYVTDIENVKLFRRRK